MKTDREILQEASQLLEEIYADLKLRSQLHDGLLSRMKRIGVDIKHHLFTVADPEPVGVFTGKKEGWINIYRHMGCDQTSQDVYASEEVAQACAEDGVRATIKIEWDE